MNERRHNFYLVTDGLYYGDRLHFVHGDTLGDHKGFQSLYAVCKEDAEALQQAGTAKGFKGVVWSERLQIDCDCNEDADRVRLYLKENSYDYMEYSTGNRGSHFGILRNSNPSHLLPQQDRAWVRKRFPFADLSIYSHLHLFRLSGTLHEKTGRPKELVFQQDGKGVEHETVDLSEYDIPDSPSPLSSIEGSILDDFQIAHYSFPAMVGNRHYSLVNVCYGLHRLSVSEANARWYLNEVNKRYKDPKETTEIDKIIQTIYK